MAGQLDMMAYGRNIERSGFEVWDVCLMNNGRAQGVGSGALPVEEDGAKARCADREALNAGV